MQQAVERSAYAGAAFVCLLAAVLVSQAEPLIEFWATSKWQPVVLLLYVLGPAYLFHVALQPLTQMLKAAGDAITPLHVSLILLVVQVAGFVVIGRSVGLIGYAASLGLGLAAATLYACLRARGRVPLRPLLHTLSPMAAAILACVAAMPINRQYAAPGGVVLSIAAAAACYMLALLLLSGQRLRREIKDAMRATGAASWIARLLAGRNDAWSINK